MKIFMLGWGLVALPALFDSDAAVIVKGKFYKPGIIDTSSWKSVGSYLATFVKSPILATTAVNFLAEAMTTKKAIGSFPVVGSVACLHV